MAVTGSDAGQDEVFSAGHGEVSGDREGLHAVGGGQLGREGVQPVDATGGEGEVAAPGGIGPGEGGAQAGRGAGDQGEGAFGAGCHGQVVRWGGVGSKRPALRSTGIRPWAGAAASSPAPHSGSAIAYARCEPDWRESPSPLRGGGLGWGPFSPCGRRWPCGAGSDEGSPRTLRTGLHQEQRIAEQNPSSDPSARGHLLPQGEKGRSFQRHPFELCERRSREGERAF